MKNLVPGATVYEIYIVPVNDLNNQQLLYSLPYPSTKFTINPVLMDANNEYAIIVKLKNAKKENECLQYIMPVKRCADCCKDVNLPRGIFYMRRQLRRSFKSSIKEFDICPLTSTNFCP